MKIKLKKTQLKTLTNDQSALAQDMTPNIAGGSSYASYRCPPQESQQCSIDCFSSPGPGQPCVIMP